MAHDIKGCLEIGIPIGEIFADSALWEVRFGGFVEFTGQQICSGLSDGCVCRPALRLFPFVSHPRSIAVDGNKYSIRSVGICPADSFFKGDVILLRNKSNGIQASLFKAADNCNGDFSCVAVFAEAAVRGAFAGGLYPVSVVNQDLHSWFRFSGSLQR